MRWNSGVIVLLLISLVATAAISPAMCGIALMEESPDTPLDSMPWNEGEPEEESSESDSDEMEVLVTQFEPHHAGPSINRDLWRTDERGLASQNAHGCSDPSRAPPCLLA